MNPQPDKEKISQSGQWVDYRYCHTNGKKFQRISRSLKACREAKDVWVKNLEER